MPSTSNQPGRERHLTVTPVPKRGGLTTGSLSPLWTPYWRDQARRQPGAGGSWRTPDGHTIVAYGPSKTGGPCRKCGIYLLPKTPVAKVDVGIRGEQTVSGHGQGEWWCTNCVGVTHEQWKGKKPQPAGQVELLPDHPARILKVHTVRTVEDLREVVATYSRFDQFAFDVETHAGRAVRVLQMPDPKVTSRYGERTKVCPSCGQIFTDARRTFCTDLCRKAADKDKPALDPMTNEVWSLSLAGPGCSHVIPMGHPDPRRQLPRAVVFEALAPLFFSDRRKINQNIAFDLLSIAKYYDGQIPPPPYGDTMVMVFLLNENLGSYSLEALARKYAGYEYAEKLGEEAYKVGFHQAMSYSLVDAKYAWLLWWKISPRLWKKASKLGALFEQEMDVLRVLMAMRQRGAYVDGTGFRNLKPILEEQLQTMGAEILKMVGHDINLNSPQQLGRYLYDELKLRCPVRTETGQRSTNAAVLRSLARKHQAPAKILAYKDVSKLLTVYVAGFLPTIDADSRIRASFNQAIAKTGRLTCSGPNLQNIPARYRENTEGTMIRQLFVAPPGKKLIVADYSQIELRVLAHQTKDRLLVYAYQHGLDLHLQTASLIYRVPQNEVTIEQRAIAKNSNFNLAFEGGPGRIVEMSGIALGEAEKVYNAWHQAYPGVKKWGKWVKRFCWDNGYVETLFGRKRRLPDISSSDMRDRSYAERQAVNHPIQGTAADIAKIGIVAVNEVLRDFDAHLTLQIHDEFVIECDEDQVAEVIPLVKTAMEDIRLGGRPVLDIPLEVNIGCGDNWSAAK